MAQAKLKGLDETTPVPSRRPPKDVNTFQNNQVKYAGEKATIPPDQMKCNILKAKREEEMKNAAAAGGCSIFYELRQKKMSSGFPTRFDTNMVIQP